MNIVLERPQKWPPKVPKMGCVAGPFLVPDFVNNLAYYNKHGANEKKEIRPQKIETVSAGTLDVF